MGRVLTLQMANPDLIPKHLYGTLSHVKSDI